MVGISIKNKTKNILEMERVFVSRSMTESIAFEIAFCQLQTSSSHAKSLLSLPPAACNQPHMRRNGDGVAL
jgi:hypothetical protein